MARCILACNETHFINLKAQQGVRTFTFDGKQYIEDPNFTIFNVTNEKINAMITQQQRIIHNDEKADLKKENDRLGLLQRYLSYSKVCAVSKFIEKLTVKRNVEFDSDFRYLPMNNGVYDLLNHELVDHSPNFYTTKYMPVDFDESAEAPEFWALVCHMFPDEKTRDFFMELIASSLMRKRHDETVFFLWGVTAHNGKTTLMSAILETMGSSMTGFGWWLDPKVFSVKRTSNSTQPELYATKNKCLSVIDEPDTTSQADSSVLKNVSNTGKMSLRTLYEGCEEFRFTSTIINLCNRLPSLDLKDAGSARRICVIPIDTQITPGMKSAPRKYDRATNEKYGDYLAANEAAGIINILMKYLKQYQQRGYCLPERSERINKATENYILKNNTVKLFVQSKCLVALDKQGQDRPYQDGSTFHQTYFDFCKNELNQERSMQAGTVIEIMEALGFQYKQICDQRTNRRNIRGYDGIRLKTEDELKREAIKEIKQDYTANEIQELIHIGVIERREWSRATITFKEGTTIDDLIDYDGLITDLSERHGVKPENVVKVLKAMVVAGEYEEIKNDRSHYLRRME